MKTPESIDEERRRRLRQEMKAESVELIRDPRHLRGGFKRVKPLRDLLLDEVYVARHTAIHERLRRTYGCILVDSTSWFDSRAEGGGFQSRQPPPEIPLEELRELADGVRTFVLRTTSEPARLVVVPASDELSLVRTCQDLGCYIIQRTGSGSVKIFADDQLISYADEEWSTKQFATSRAYELSRFISLDDLDVGGDMNTAMSLLETASHRLSASHVGAALVWFLTPDAETAAVDLINGGRPPSVPLNINDASDVEILTSLLAHVDGATLIDPAGSVTRVGTQLNASDGARTLISRERGMRHTSAKLFSFDMADCVVIVVSEDGPVTVYSDGVALMHLREVGTYAASLQKMVPAKAGHIEADVRDLTCPRCGKPLRVEVTVILGWKDRESVNCPVCGQADVYSQMSFHISAMPRKRWSRSRLFYF